MANLEEKVEAFLSDEKKAEALENDEKFLDAVSGGTATPETIAQKFGELGLPLSDDEAVRVEKTTQKIFSIEPEQLADVELNSVTGGLNSSALYHGVAKLGVVSGAAGGVGCWIASTVCKKEAAKALKNGDETKHIKLIKAAT